MELNLKGKRALVTGGSKGIGWACAGALADEGCDVMIAARNPFRKATKRTFPKL
jgi:NAD(P)-dependent dehydrogenase (short-subunit alcohol dehydrogenase family)